MAPKRREFSHATRSLSTHKTSQQAKDSN